MRRQYVPGRWAELHALEAVEQTYYLPEFLSGRRAPEHEGADVVVIRRQGRIDGVGELDVHIRVDRDNIIRSVNISGDFFVLSELDDAF